MIDNFIYNPANQSKSSLIENFVVRTKAFEKIFRDIESSDMKYPEQHYLIQGQRGMGKTTLLLRLKYEIENTAKLNNWLVPVFFNEESYDLTSLSNLWEKLFKYLDELWETGGEYYAYSEKFMDLPDYEKNCFGYLMDTLHKNGKKLVILFDNFGQLFLENLKEQEKRRLREILMSCNDIRIIGASAIVLNDIHDYSQPFFEFFKVIPLEGLDKEETFQLISKLQEKDDVKIDLRKNKAKIETLAILTGGVIRTVMLIYEIILTDEDGSALRDLEIVLDRITPLYKHRIEDLPVQQRKIIDVIAKQWDAVSTKDISNQIRENGKKVATKIISAQLQQLEKNNVIEKKTTNTKNHLYQVKERFFNIWYLMRNGDRKDQRKVRWLTKFLELWYDNEEGFDVFMRKHIELLKTGTYDTKAAILMSEALVSSDKLNIMNLEKLLHETSAILTDEQRIQLPDISLKKRSAGLKFYEQRKTKEAIEILSSIKDRDSLIQLILAYCYRKEGDLDSMVKAIKNMKYNVNGDSILQAEIFIEANLEDEARVALAYYEKHEDRTLFINEGNVHYGLGNIEKAEKAYLKALKNNYLEAYSKMADLYTYKSDFEAAEQMYKIGLEKGADLIKVLLNFYLFKDKRRKSLIYAMDFIKSIDDRKYLKDPEFILYKALLTSMGYDEDGDETSRGQSFRDLEKALTLYVKAGFNERDIVYFVVISVLMFGYLDTPSNKLRAIRLVNEICLPNEYFFMLFSAFTLIWNSKYDEGISQIYLYREKMKEIDETQNQGMYNRILLLLLSRKQYHLCLQIFNDFSDLKDILKPTYYALMSFLTDDFPNEFTKMGKELEQPVNDILKKIEKMAIDYK